MNDRILKGNKVLIWLLKQDVIVPEKMGIIAPYYPTWVCTIPEEYLALRKVK